MNKVAFQALTTKIKMNVKAISSKIVLALNLTTGLKFIFMTEKLTEKV